jgi:protein SCO1
MNTSAPGSNSLPIALVLAVALAAGLGLVAGQRWFTGDDLRGVSLQGGLVYPAPRELAEFSLDAAAGAQLGPSDLAGEWTLVFVGFTHCPDICPTTLAQLAAVQQQADNAGEPVPQVLFLSVDPERDSPDRAAEYARFFSPRVLAATADHERLTPFTRNLGMVYMQSPLDDGGYTVDHSASVAVIDPQLRLVAQLRPPLDPATIVADLKRLRERR